MTMPDSEKTVLLVEDVAVNRRVAAAFLAKQGHRVVEAVSGAEALAALDRQIFDLVLLDIRLPDMDGVEVARQIRACQDPQRAMIPILALTANVFPDDIKRYRDVGMNGVVAKPIQLDQFRSTIATILPANTSGSSAPSGGGAGQATGVDWQTGDVLDVDFITERLATLGEATFLAILRIGQRSVAEAHADLTKARQAGQVAALAKAAHRLAGAASNFGYAGLFVLSRHIEQLAISANNVDQGRAFDLALSADGLMARTQMVLQAWLTGQDLRLTDDVAVDE